MRATLILAVALGPMLAVPLEADTIHVPGDYPTIQEAIDAAVDRDVVLVAPGTYVENIDFIGKGITVTSSDGPAVTTIDGNQLGSVVSFIQGEGPDSVIEGFTVTNGRGSDTEPYTGGGIICQGTSPTVRESVVTRNQARAGGGICCREGGTPLILDCLITENSVANAGWGGGLYSGGGSFPVAANCVIANNTSNFEGGGVMFGWQGGGFLINCVVWGNDCPRGGGLFVWTSTSEVWNSIFWANTADQINVLAAQLTVAYSDIQGGFAGVGNINADPLLLDPSTLDFHLTFSSPCIDSGSNSAPYLPSFDFDGDARIINGTVDMGADEHARQPVITSVSPDRGRYDQTLGTTIGGQNFSLGAWTEVLFGDEHATDIVVVDDQTITCTTPTGDPGPVVVTVRNDYGEGAHEDGFVYSPALLLDGDHRPGGDVTATYLLDVNDAIFAIWGLPPPKDIETPPYDGRLGIVPFHVIFIMASWPFDEFELSADIPDDPALSGVQVLLQALVGDLGAKDGAWTNLGWLEIE